MVWPLHPSTARPALTAYSVAVCVTSGHGRSCATHLPPHTLGSCAQAWTTAAASPSLTWGTAVHGWVVGVAGSGDASHMGAMRACVHHNGQHQALVLALPLGVEVHPKVARVRGREGAVLVLHVKVCQRLEVRQPAETVAAVRDV